MSLEVLSQCALAVGSMMILLWLWSVAKKNVSVVDPWWSIGFLLVSLVSVRGQVLTPGKVLLLFLVAAWAIRLWLHLLKRSWGGPEDPRYTAFRKRFGPERYWWFSLFQVFGLQGVLILLISVPLQLSLLKTQPDPITEIDLLGFALCLFGIVVESTADSQLQEFRANANNRGKVLQSGLWRYSRHPNYFGESVIWWGFWMFSLDSSWGFISVFAPLLMTYLLLRVSGVTMLESQLKTSKPGYAEYIERTSAFVLWPPKKGKNTDD